MEGAPSEDFLKTYAHRINHRSCQRAVGRIKLSVEAKVAAAVALAFATLTIGVIAGEGNEQRTAAVSQAGLQGSEISLSGNASSESLLVAQY
jgi:hypothetical protein